MVSLLVLAPVMSSADGLDLKTRDACVREDSYRSSAVVVLVDRTTILDTAAQERWANGVATILGSYNVVGKLSILEVRESAVGARLLGSGCLSDFRPQDKQVNEVSIVEHPWEWTKEIGRRAWKKVTVPRRSDKEESDRIWDERSARTEYTKALRTALTIDRPTGTNTEIAQSLISALQSTCGAKSTCRVYLFSDLLDSAAKREVRSADVEQKGGARARALLQEMRPEISAATVTIKVWGFGRDDTQSGRPLDDLTRRSVRNYWRGYFDEVGRSAAEGSSYDIVDMLRDP